MKNHWKKNLTVLVLLVLLAAYVFISHSQVVPAVTGGFIFIFFGLVVLFPLTIPQKRLAKQRAVSRLQGRAPPSK